MIKNTYFLAFVILLLGCKTTSKTENKFLNSDSDIFDFYTLTNPIWIRIIYYNEACDCGIRACSSITIGISDQDTIRVLTPCNNDTIFKVGMKVKVIPILKENSDFTYPLSYIDGQMIDVLPINERRFKTYFGKILPR